MTTVTVLAGERTMGGTQIVLEDEGARLLFDCGIPYDPGGNPFAHVRRRPWRALSDLLALGLTPVIPGLYPPGVEDELPVGLSHALPESDGPLAVAVSHAHLDHSLLVGFVDPSVPVYTSEASARIIGVQSETGVNLAHVTRPLIALPPGEPFDVGPMRVRLVSVDHDIGGACGLIAETTGGVIAYSGDLRLHGPYPMRTLAFAHAAREADTRLLILEGTRLRPPSPSEDPGPVLYERVEGDVVPDIMHEVADVPGRLAVILLSPDNGERVEMLARAAHDAGRLLALDPEGLAYVLAALGRPLAAPHAVYIPAETALAMEDGWEPPAMVRAAIAGAPRIVPLGEIAAAPGRYLLRLPFERFADLIEMVPRGGGGLLISANDIPLGRFDPAWAHLELWAHFFGMTLVEKGSTGHAAARDLTLIAAHSGASTVMPVHSFYPELMPVPPERLLIPERGRTYDLSELAESTGHDR
jgi:ribonuclease J